MINSEKMEGHFLVFLIMLNELYFVRDVKV